MAARIERKDWLPDEKVIIDQFKALGPAPAPFQMASWVLVTDPERCFKTLEADIAMGPNGARAFTGALMEELKMYVDHMTDFS